MSRVRLLGGRQSIQVDMVWLFWTVVAFTLFLYSQIYIDIDPAIASKSMIGFSLLIGSLVMSSVLVGFKSDNFFSLQDFAGGLGFVLVSIVSIYVVNIYSASVQLSAVPISSTMFMMLMAVAEETLFRGFLLTMFTRMLNSSLLGVGVSSVMGVAYHAAVYGANPTSLLIVFGSFSVLGLCYIFSGYRLSIPMTAHVLVNYMASVG